jgi:CRP/FNR family transcriptional regulator, transcriptional activator FtrB
MAALARKAHLRDFKPGEALFHRKEPSRFVHVILSGRIGIFDVYGDGEARLVDVIRPGETIAGPSALLREPHALSAWAVDNARVVRIPAGDIRRAFHRDPALAGGIALNMIAHLRRTLVQVINLKHRNSAQRIGHYLLGLTDKRRGAVTVILPDDQEFIAELLGITRESLSRSFGQLRRVGVAKQGRRVAIADIDRLQHYAQSSKSEVRPRTPPRAAGR